MPSARASGTRPGGVARHAALAAAVLFAAMAVEAAPAAAAEPSEILDAGNAAYRRGDYAAAATAYEELRSAGHGSADLLYNLGNAYLKGGDLGTIARELTLLGLFVAAYAAVALARFRRTLD